MSILYFPAELMSYMVCRAAERIGDDALTRKQNVIFGLNSALPLKRGGFCVS